MKYYEYKIDNNTLEFWNTISGVEVLKINGKEISRKFSFLGAKHAVKIGSDNYTIKPIISLLKVGGFRLSTFKNGEQISLENSLKENEKRRIRIAYIIRMIIAGALGLFIGHEVVFFG